MQACILSFSSRKGGNCDRIAELIAQNTEGRVLQFAFSALTVTGCGQCGYACFRDRMQCPYIQDAVCDIFDAMLESRMTYWIVPNYCDYPCSNFFLLNERSQCYFNGRPNRMEQYLAVPKKFVVVSNTGRENFTTAFCDHVTPGEKPDILFLSAAQYHKISLSGDLMTSQAAQQALLQFIGVE